MPQPIPEKVQSAILKSFPDQAESILNQLEYSSLMGCYYFERWGMFVGVEPDGYIHT